MLDAPKPNKVIAVSGGFDPLHEGHLALFAAAKQRAPLLTVILESDEWISRKHPPLLGERNREALVRGLAVVDHCLLSRDVSHTLASIKPDIYGVGIDHADLNFPEAAVCRKLGIEIAVLKHHCPQVRSSLLLAKSKVWRANPPISVDALIEGPRGLLLIRRASREGRGLLDLPGGFVEAGETLEQALSRELSEELLTRPSEMRYLGSWAGAQRDGRKITTAFFECRLAAAPCVGEGTGELVWTSKPPIEKFYSESNRIAVEAWFARRGNK